MVYITRNPHVNRKSTNGLCPSGHIPYLLVRLRETPYNQRSPGSCSPSTPKGFHSRYSGFQPIEADSEKGPCGRLPAVRCNSVPSPALIARA